jgi:hypothetical protein
MGAGAWIIEGWLKNSGRLRGGLRTSHSGRTMRPSLGATTNWRGILRPRRAASQLGRRARLRRREAGALAGAACTSPIRAGLVKPDRRFAMRGKALWTAEYDQYRRHREKASDSNCEFLVILYPRL